MSFSKKKILVVGDTILDRFVYGDVNRISPEAPNLILDQTDEQLILGGAYNVARVLRDLGNEVTYLSISGAGGIFSSLIQDGIQEGDVFLWDESRPVTVKSRYVANYKKTTLLRTDIEVRGVFPDSVYTSALDLLADLIKGCDLICVSDYDKGMLGDSFVETLLEYSQLHKLRVMVDTKKKNLKCYRGAWLVKPNNFELAFVKGFYGNPSMSDGDIAKRLYDDLSIENLVITKGAKGIDYFNQGRFMFSDPAHDVVPVELSGAGDVVLSALGHCVANGLALDAAIKYANKVGATFVSKGPLYRLSIRDFEG